MLKRATGLLFKITAGFLNAATSVLKRVSVRIFKISKCCHRSKQNVYFYFFSMTRHQNNLKTIGEYIESTDLNFRTYRKKYSFPDTIPLDYKESIMPFKINLSKHQTWVTCTGPKGLFIGLTIRVT
jgi:hypothetical protein